MGEKGVELRLHGGDGFGLHAGAVGEEEDAMDEALGGGEEDVVGELMES